MTRFNMRVGDASCNNLHCGDSVLLKNDPRHTGVVQLITWGSAHVLWNETGWISDEPCDDLEKIYA